MIEFMVESQTIMDLQTINERYCDSIVCVATETGWTIDYVLNLPPWTLNQIIDSKKRINQNTANNNDGVLNNRKDRLLSG
jgi:hypothetical protein